MSRPGCVRLAAAACLWAAAAQAAVSSADGRELSRAAIDAGGGPAFSGSGGASVSFSLGQPVGTAQLAGGGSRLSGGFYSGGTSGVRNAASLVESVAPLCPDPAQVRIQGEIVLGIGRAQPVCIGFAASMLPATISVAVRWIKDRTGAAPADPSVAVQTEYRDSPVRLIISTPTAGWEPNSLYRVVVSTEARDEQGEPLPEPGVLYFATLAETATPNEFTAVADAGTRLSVAPNVLPSGGIVEIATTPVRVSPGLIAAANASLQRTFGPLSSVHGVREINYYSELGQNLGLRFPAGSASLSIPYADADGDGVIDGTSPPARVRSAALYHLDEARSLWVRLPGSRVEGGRVTAPIPHLSVFALIVPQATSVEDAYAFPVPFRPRGPDAGTGPGQTGSEASGISFTNLPSPATVEVFNVRGERVWRGEETSGGGLLAWDTRNGDGSLAASGVYVYVVGNGAGAAKTGKLVIVR
ncbi:MAG: hypothetical protein HY554_13550 [Elusimicrobia bacterium]|nr:hypothetical protein [Elusimicrobiota bacterium]